MKNTYNRIVRFIFALALIALGGMASVPALHAQGTSGTDYSSMTSAATGAITAAQSNTFSILVAAVIAATIFLVYKWIRKGMGKA